MIARWTIRKLFGAPSSLLANVAAIAAAFVLVLVFEAVWTGESDQIVAYAEHADADVWVMQDGVSNMHMATSFVPDSTLTRIRDVDGVAEAAAILYLNTLVRAGDEDWFSYVVGIEEPDQLGSPWALSSGRKDIAPGEAIVPEVVAAASGLEVGDEIGIADERFTIAGLSTGTFSVANPITFVRSADLADVLSLVGYDSYVLVRAEPGVTPAGLSNRIVEQIDDVEAVPTSEFIRNDRALAAQMGVELIGLMTTISALLAAILIAFTLYVHTARSSRDLAVLKALGFRDRHAYGGVVLQAVVLTGCAAVVAAGLAAAIAEVAPRLVPQLSMRLTLQSVVEVAATGLAIGLATTVIAARQVVRVDPLKAFQA